MEETPEIDVAVVVRWLSDCSRELSSQADHLTRLDAAIGDGDHGRNMERGFGALAIALAEGNPPAGVGPVLILAGNTVVSNVGGASGPLWGSLLLFAGRELGEAPNVTVAEFAAGLRAGLEEVKQLGAAAVGDKTMVDALTPAVEALEDPAGWDLRTRLLAAAEAARLGARDTVQMRARRGRASYLGERSIGHEDPGAASSAIIVKALAEAVG